MNGRVTSGQGRAAEFVGEIAPLIDEELKFDPFLGTLNLTDCVRPEDFPQQTFRGIEPGGSACDGVRFFECSVEGVRGAIVYPLIDGYPDEMVELIAPVNLRSTLGLADGDSLTVTRREDCWPSTGADVAVEALSTFDAVVFDLDGTLVDLAVEWESVRDELDDLLSSYVSGDLFGSEVELATVARENGVYERYLDCLATAEREGATHATSRETLDALTELSERSVPVGVCTRNSVDAAEIALEQFDLLDTVETIVGRETRLEQKPHPAPLAQCFSTLDARPGNAVFIGNDETDCETARRAETSFFHPDRLSGAR